jgi:hypothetical protein
LKQDAEKTVTEEPKKLPCGIVMPISAIDSCTESHWEEVLEILTDAIQHAGFDGNLVSNADEVGIIHKRIIQNLYDNPVVVCDVSGKNPNVMFELGLRLAFDKPTLIVKDDKTAISFDTSGIEHLEYPRDLRFSRIVEFKRKLSEKIAATHKKATSDRSYTTFLKQFGEFTVAKLDKKEVSGQEYILDELRALRSLISSLPRELTVPRGGSKVFSRNVWREPDEDPFPTDILVSVGSTSKAQELAREAMKHPQIRAISIREGQGITDSSSLMVSVKPDTDLKKLTKELFDNYKCAYRGILGL